MRLLDEMTVHHGDKTRTVALYQGDLTELPREEAVEVLVVSAFPDDYTPTTGSLIGALHSKGVFVARLAVDKEADLRRTCSCWLSRKIQVADAPFQRILCFEPPAGVKPSQVVGDIFRTLVPFLGTDAPSSTLAMPLVSSGDAGNDPGEMLSHLLDAAAHWMSLGLPLQRLKIVERSPEKAAYLHGAFSVLKQKYGEVSVTPRPTSDYDVFVSYAHNDSGKMHLIVEELRNRRPSLRIFVDRQNLNPGAAWQQQIYNALDACRSVMPLYSPAYLASKVCMEELNIALYRHRNSEDGILFPVYLYTADMPTFLKIHQYQDCREGDELQLRGACDAFLSHLGG